MSGPKSLLKFQSLMLLLQMQTSSDDEDDDFDEVPEKEGYEPHIPEHLRAEYGELVFIDTHKYTHVHLKSTDTCINNEVKLQKKI